MSRIEGQRYNIFLADFKLNYAAFVLHQLQAGWHNPSTIVFNTQKGKKTIFPYKYGLSLERCVHNHHVSMSLSNACDLCLLINNLKHCFWLWRLQLNFWISQISKLCNVQWHGCASLVFLWPNKGQGWCRSVLTLSQLFTLAVLI